MPSTLPIQFALCSLLRASCLGFSLDKFKIFLFHETFEYGWISMAIASSHQNPHHHRWYLPLWHSPRLTLSLSLSLIWVSLFSPLKLSRGPSFCFHSHLSPLAVPFIGVTTTGGRRSSSLILYFLSLLFFFNFYLPFRQDRNPFDTHFVSFFY